MVTTKLSDRKTSWLLLSYKIPPEPAKVRVALWRKVKACGAVYIQNSVCLLPHTATHRRTLLLLQKDIESNHGEAYVMEALGLDAQQESRLVARFNADRDEEYDELLEKCDDFLQEIAKETAAGFYAYAEVQENEADLKKLKTWLAKIRKLDFCRAAKGEDAAQRLVECERALDAYANEVFTRDAARLD